MTPSVKNFTQEDQEDIERLSSLGYKHFKAPNILTRITLPIRKAGWVHDHTETTGSIDPNATPIKDSLPGIYEARNFHTRYSYRDVPHSTYQDGNYRPPLSDCWYNSARRHFASLQPNTINAQILVDWAKRQAEAGRDTFGLLDKINEAARWNKPYVLDWERDKYENPTPTQIAQTNPHNVENLHHMDLMEQLDKQQFGDLPHFSSPHLEETEWAYLGLNPEQRIIALHLVNHLLVPVLNGDLRVIADFVHGIKLSKEEGQIEDNSLYHNARDALPLYRHDWQNRQKPEFDEQAGVFKDANAPYRYEESYARIADWRRIHWSLHNDRDYYMDKLKKEYIYPPMSHAIFLGVNEKIPPLYIRWRIDNLTPKKWHEPAVITTWFYNSRYVLDLAEAAWPTEHTVPPLSAKAIPLDPGKLFYENVVKAKNPYDALIPKADKFGPHGESLNGLMHRDDIMMVYMALDLFYAIQTLGKTYKQPNKRAWLTLCSDVCEPKMTHEYAANVIAAYALNIPFVLDDYWEVGREMGAYPVFHAYFNEDGKPYRSPTDRAHTFYRPSAFSEFVQRELAKADRLVSLWDDNVKYLTKADHIERDFVESLAVNFYQQAQDEINSLVENVLMPWINEYIPEHGDHISPLDHTRAIYLKEGPTVTSDEKLQRIMLDKDRSVVSKPTYFNLEHEYHDSFVEMIDSQDEPKAYQEAAARYSYLLSESASQGDKYLVSHYYLCKEANAMYQSFQKTLPWCSTDQEHNAAYTGFMQKTYLKPYCPDVFDQCLDADDYWHMEPELDFETAENEWNNRDKIRANAIAEAANVFLRQKRLLDEHQTVGRVNDGVIDKMDIMESLDIFTYGEDYGTNNAIVYYGADALLHLLQQPTDNLTWLLQDEQKFAPYALKKTSADDLKPIEKHTWQYVSMPILSFVDEQDTSENHEINKNNWASDRVEYPGFVTEVRLAVQAANNSYKHREYLNGIGFSYLDSLHYYPGDAEQSDACQTALLSGEFDYFATELLEEVDKHLVSAPNRPISFTPEPPEPPKPQTEPHPGPYEIPEDSMPF